MRWDFMAGLLPYGIEPTDIDLCIERNGHFLFMEGKREAELMPRGQERCLAALARGPRSISVVTFRGTPPDDIVSYTPWGKDTRSTTTEQFQSHIRAWFHLKAEAA